MPSVSAILKPEKEQKSTTIFVASRLQGSAVEAGLAELTGRILEMFILADSDTTATDDQTRLLVDGHMLG